MNILTSTKTLLLSAILSSSLSAVLEPIINTSQVSDDLHVSEDRVVEMYKDFMDSRDDLGSATDKQIEVEFNDYAESHASRTDMLNSSSYIPNDKK